MADGAKGFEDLRIFQEAKEITRQIWNTTRERPFSSDWVLVGQIRPAARAEFGRFLKIAKRSRGEVRAQMMIAARLHYVMQRACEEFCARARHVREFIESGAIPSGKTP